MLEFGHVAAGPFGSMLLADLGADVVKVESPAGDQMRGWPPIAEADGERFSHNFAAVNRNKRSVVADLKDPADLARVQSLVHAADVVVENYRPGVLDRLGLGYADVSADHRGIVYASVSGFGQTGAYAGMGAYDVVIQAMSGMMSVTGTDDGELVKAGVPVADFVSGLYAALGVVAWLPVVRATGSSVHLDVPMLDCLLATSALQTSEYWGTGVEPSPRGTRHPRNAPYQVFVAADGPFVLAAGTDRLWLEVCRVIGDEALADRLPVRPPGGPGGAPAGAGQAAQRPVRRASGHPVGRADARRRCPVRTGQHLRRDPRRSGRARQRPGPADAGAGRRRLVDHGLPGPGHRRGASPRPGRAAPRRADRRGPGRVGRRVTTLTHAEVGSVRLLLDRPGRANALDVATVERLHDELDRAERDNAAVIVLEARGRAFCGGLDLSDLDHETDATLLHRLVRIQLLLEWVQSSPALTIALVDGPAVGAGADLVLAADVRLATPAASLRFPGSRFGAVLGTGRLAAETSPSYATEAALSARRIDADEAASRGLWRLFDSPTDFRPEVDRLAAAAASAPAGTTAGLRRAATPSTAGDPLGDLVRSLATPGLCDRIREHRDRGAS